MGRDGARHAGAVVQRQRFARACSSVCCIAVAVCAALGAAERASGEAAATSAASQAVFQAMMEGAALEEAMADVGFTADASAVPSWFAREVLDVAEVDEWYAADAFEAVFVSVAADPEGVSGLRARLEDRGWRVVADDGEGVLSLKKDEGTCRWMTVSVRETAAGWEAVLHIQPISPEMDGARKVGSGS